MKTNSCFICEQSKFRSVFTNRPSMSSDGQTVDFQIEKQECLNCGTIRTKDTSFLENFYKSTYSLNARNLDPTFIYDKRPYSKSEMHFEWITHLLLNNGININEKDSLIEIGCGSGNLLSLFKTKDKFGVEPSQEASAFASQNANVRNIGYEVIDNSEKYDIILSTCVIEHTQNPNDFLKKIFYISKKDSVVIIGLPIQDTESFDVFFLDHLHHFTSKQFIHLCNKNGFDVIDYEITYKCISTLGYFILKKNIDKVQSTKYKVQSTKYKVQSTKYLTYEPNKNFQISSQYLNNLNEFLNYHANAHLFAFGYGETSFFFQTYSTINKIITVYIDDVHANGKNIITLSAFLNKHDLPNKFTIILLINPHYNEFIKEKFSKFTSIVFYSPFEN